MPWWARRSLASPRFGNRCYSKRASLATRTSRAWTRPITSAAGATTARPVLTLGIRTGFGPFKCTLPAQTGGPLRSPSCGPLCPPWPSPTPAPMSHSPAGHCDRLQPAFQHQPRRHKLVHRDRQFPRHQRRCLCPGAPKRLAPVPPATTIGRQQRSSGLRSSSGSSVHFHACNSSAFVTVKPAELLGVVGCPSRRGEAVANSVGSVCRPEAVGLA